MSTLWHSRYAEIVFLRADGVETLILNVDIVAFSICRNSVSTYRVYRNLNIIDYYFYKFFFKKKKEPKKLTIIKIYYN
jgi:hypothetical protein